MIKNAVLLALSIFYSCISYSQGPVNKDTSVVTPKDSIMTFKDGGPQYPGGVKGWSKYLNKSFRYPDEAAQDGIQGMVFIKFLVNEEGYVSEVQPIIGHQVLAEECVRIIKESGKWIPHTKDGKNVKAYKIQQFAFKLHLSGASLR